MTAPSLSPVSGTRVTVQELRDSIRKLARGKASDSSGVHAALLHALVHDDPRTQGPLFHMHRLVCEYWSDRPLSHELWKKSVLVPIFLKGKGDFQDLNNHRGIVLLDILSKMVSRVLTERLLPVVERMCTASEMGFRRGQGTTDAVFTLRRLFEVWGHTRPLPGGPPPEDDYLYVLFVDLSKAFDSVNRQRLWQILTDKLCIPSHFVSMLKRMHRGLRTQVLQAGRLGRAVPICARECAKARLRVLPSFCCFILLCSPSGGGAVDCSSVRIAASSGSRHETGPSATHLEPDRRREIQYISMSLPTQMTRCWSTLAGTVLDPPPGFLMRF